MTLILGMTLGYFTKTLLGRQLGNQSHILDFINTKWLWVQVSRMYFISKHESLNTVSKPCPCVTLEQNSGDEIPESAYKIPTMSKICNKLLLKIPNFREKNTENITSVSPVVATALLETTGPCSLSWLKYVCCKMHQVFRQLQWSMKSHS